MEEIKRKIENINKLQAGFDKHKVNVKEEFAQVIKDKSIPLSERWELFESAPAPMKEQKGWIEHLPHVDDDIGYDGNLLYVERHQDVFIDEIFVAIDENEYEISLEKLDELKEYILDNNLGSYNYDW